MPIVVTRSADLRGRRGVPIRPTLEEGPVQGPVDLCLYARCSALCSHLVERGRFPPGPGSDAGRAVDALAERGGVPAVARVLLHEVLPYPPRRGDHPRT